MALRNKTVLIIGAGASKEVGMPIGSELCVQIAECLKLVRPSGSWVISDDVIQDSMLRYVGGAPPGQSRGSLADYVQAAGQISTAMQIAVSIDNFLEAHQANPHIQLTGKAAIVRQITKSENRSELCRATSSRPPTLGGLANTWTATLFQMLSEGVGLEQVELLFSNLAIVNFNYDRTVEHFLLELIKIYYPSVPEPETIRLVRGIPHFHPYGTVGPWHEAQNGHRPFGALADDFDSLLPLSERIRTYSEQSADARLPPGIHSEIAAADVVVFLGFAYHPLNLRLLAPAFKGASTAKVYGTALHMSPENAHDIKITLTSMFASAPVYNRPEGVELVDSTANDFLNSRRRPLTMR